MDLTRLYYRNRDGSILLNKEKVWASIDPYDVETVVYWCKIMDVPFLYDEWFKLVCRAKEKNQDPTHCIGKYFSLMRLCSYKEFRFRDTYRLNSYESAKKWERFFNG